jgi:hypothetical protein
MELRHHLDSPKTRRQLASGLRDAVERAEFSGRAGAVAPVARTSVLANRELIAELAGRLESDRKVGVCGVAAARELLTDAASPLWIPGEREALRRSLEVAIEGLGT